MNVADLDLQPVTCGLGEHPDNYREGTDTSGNLVKLYSSLVCQVYRNGTWIYGGITDPQLFTNGIGADGEMVVYEDVARPIKAVDGQLAKLGLQLEIYSGFIPPSVQHNKFIELQRHRNPAGDDPRAEIMAGDWADASGAGSVAEVNDPNIIGVLDGYRQDGALMKELSDMAKEGLGESAEALLLKLVTYRANARKLNLKIDKSTARTIHNLARSFNAGIKTRNSGGRLLMGAPLDVPGPYQRLDFYEYATPAQIEQLIRDDAFFRRYLVNSGITRVNEELIDSFKHNRRLFFDFMKKAGLNLFEDEWGHVTVYPKDGNFSSRAVTYDKVRALGLKAA